MPAASLGNTTPPRFLEPGESSRREVNIPLEELAVYRMSHSQWIVPDGEYEVLIGTSSQQIDFRVKANITPERRL
jgi:hypothetical protein